MGIARKRAGVVSRESKGQTKSCDDQDRENLAACEEHDDWDVVNLYRDGVSASRFGTRVRKDWNRLVADVEAGKLDVVVAWEVSRAERDLERWVPFVATCRRLGTLVHVTSHETTYDPGNRRHWRALIDEGVDAADESEKISARSLKGIRGAALAGKAHGRAPYGLAREYWYETVNGRQVRCFTQVPGHRVEIVQEIIERTASLDPIVAMQRDLTERGIPTPGDEPWHPPKVISQWGRSSIRQIVRNPAYAGLREHLPLAQRMAMSHRQVKGVLYTANWDPVVDPATWREANAVLDDEGRKTTQPGSFKWLLSYLAHGQCGGDMQARPRKEGRRDLYGCHADGCVSIGVWELDEYVTRVVVAWFARKGARALFERADAEAEAARTELAELNRELEEARAAYARPRGISETALAMKEHALAPLVEDAQRRIVSATAPAAAMALLTAAEAGEQLIRPVWDGLSIAARRSVIAALMEEVRVRPADERLSRWSPDRDRLRLAAERTTITWVPRASAVR